MDDKNQNMEMLAKVGNYLLQQKPMNREQIKAMISSIDQSVLEKYLGRDKAQTVSDQELESIYKFLGI